MSVLCEQGSVEGVSPLADVGEDTLVNGSVGESVSFFEEGTDSLDKYATRLGHVVKTCGLHFSPRDMIASVHVTGGLAERVALLVKLLQELRKSSLSHKMVHKVVHRTVFGGAERSRGKLRGKRGGRKCKPVTLVEGDVDSEVKLPGFDPMLAYESQWDTPGRCYMRLMKPWADPYLLGVYPTFGRILSSRAYVWDIKALETAFINRNSPGVYHVTGRGLVPAVEALAGLAANVGGWKPGTLGCLMAARALVSDVAVSLRLHDVLGGDRFDRPPLSPVVASVASEVAELFPGRLYVAFDLSSLPASVLLTWSRFVVEKVSKVPVLSGTVSYVRSDTLVILAFRPGLKGRFAGSQQMLELGMSVGACGFELSEHTRDGYVFKVANVKALPPATTDGHGLGMCHHCFGDPAFAGFEAGIHAEKGVHRHGGFAEAASVDASKFVIGAFMGFERTGRILVRFSAVAGPLHLRLPDVCLGAYFLAPAGVKVAGPAGEWREVTEDTWLMVDSGLRVSIQYTSAVVDSMELYSWRLAHRGPDEPMVTAYGYSGGREPKLPRWVYRPPGF